MEQYYYTAAGTAFHRTVSAGTRLSGTDLRLDRWCRRGELPASSLGDLAIGRSGDRASGPVDVAGCEEIPGSEFDPGEGRAKPVQLPAGGIGCGKR